ncbi:MAG: hypothetical protein R3E32_22025 [Chitinophagales bacterium]
MNHLFSSILISSFLLWISACTNDQAELPGPCGISGEVSFAGDIQPILATYCYFPGTNNSCHITGFADGDYTSYAGVAAKAAIIKQRVVIERTMPPLDSTEGAIEIADACDITLIQTWIDEGAKNN